MHGATVTASYVHVQRCLDLLGSAYRGSTTPPQDSIHRGIFLSQLTRAVVAWLANHQIRTLGQLIASSELDVGSVFSHVGAFFCRGVSAYLDGKRTELPEIYAKLDDFRDGFRLTADLNPEHFTSVSSSTHLSGKSRLFFAGIVADATERLVRARPIIIGILGASVFGGDADLGFPHVESTAEIYISQIDSFEAAWTARNPSVEQLESLRHIPETAVKEAFASIIGEPFVPNDWGGEISDLTSTQLVVEGIRTSAAFAFKGPSKFHPLTVADMGKNGDQIFRLFNEPADLLVVQHCHKITSPVRAHMRAFATQPGRGRMFCLIDGADTFKILRAYGKCGL